MTDGKVRIRIFVLGIILLVGGATSFVPVILLSLVFGMGELLMKILVVGMISGVALIALSFAFFMVALIKGEIK